MAHPRLIGRYWFERGIGDFGQSMGVTATGLILMRVVDPKGKSPAFEAFGYKQLVFEPFFGGGLITALAIPVIYLTGVWPLFFVMLTVFVASIVIGLVFLRPRDARARGTHSPDATDSKPIGDRYSKDAGSRSLPGGSEREPASVVTASNHRE